MLKRLAVIVFLLCIPCGSYAQQNNVETTQPLTPEQQLSKFHLPPGFKIELFAAEPQIEKPTNIAFDTQGRLWVSSTTEYPFAAKPGQGRDRIQVLEDSDGNGRVDRVTTFVDDLNIPMGLYPYRNGVIAYSIPNIYFFQDQSGDGKADRRDVLYGPLDEPVDTHGMQNSFRRGFDDWIYVSHGFRNDSTITGTDGSQITLNSGSSYRIKLDGSRVEAFTRGQVNPFGSVFLANGDLISADCHSKPLSVLLRSGFYSSFGKPHDGLGYVPDVITHNHGSTAIAGVESTTGTNFPDEYQDSLLVGNVVTNRIHRDVLSYHGSTAELREAADFLTCDDPWFRPVDMRIGPDGALYVADFYNRIIGHYEVPLEHPGRDRTRGRIWRITYTGKSPSRKKIPSLAEYNLAKADLPELIQALQNPILGIRNHATDEICDRFGPAAVEPVRDAIENSNNEHLNVHGLWILHRLGSLTQKDILRAVQHHEPLVRNHAMRVLAESTSWNDDFRQWVIAGLHDADAHVQRAAADALGQHSERQNVQLLVDVLRLTPDDDTHLRHTIRMSLRNHLRVDGVIAEMRQFSMRSEQLGSLAQVALAVESGDAAALILDSIRRSQPDAELLHLQLRHVARFGSESDLARLITIVKRQIPDNVDLQIEFLELINQHISNASKPNQDVVMNWARSLLDQLQKFASADSNHWANQTETNPWGIEDRNCADGQVNVRFLSSLPGGESATGKLTSKTFALPRELSFYLCGHRGFPQDEAGTGNCVRLRLAKTHQLIETAFPPRNDIAQKIKWDLNDFAGQQGYLEIVDENQLGAFAWLAVSRFEPPLITVPQLSPSLAMHRQIAQARIIQFMKMVDQVDRLKESLVAEHVDWQVQVASAEALVAVEYNSLTSALVSILREGSLEHSVRTNILQTIADTESSRVEMLQLLMKTAPQHVQEILASHLATDQNGAQSLIDLVISGAASARLLQVPDIKEKLVATRLPNIEGELTKLTRGLVPIEDHTASLIRKLALDIRNANPSAVLGRKVFKENCASCHQIRGEGAVVGPQLDGIGNRGIDRILEDVLDPNRNVDGAFVSTIMLLEDGRVVSGLFRRQEGDLSVFVDDKGKEFSIPAETIDEQKKSHMSVMPGNLGTTLKEQDCANLVAYLLTMKEKAPSLVEWAYRKIDERFRSEGVTVADVNRDGEMDILVGELWYQGPDWVPYEISQTGEYGDGAKGYSRNFICFSHDINGDQWPDQIVVGMPGSPCHWYENPKGAKGHWPKHEIWESACNETPLFVDLFQDGNPVLIMAWHPGGKEENGQMIWLRPGKDPTDRWTPRPISTPGSAERPVPGTKRFSHGLGAGDINNDGRLDVVCTGGWWEQPKTVGDHPWVFHPADLGPACANMFVVDINADNRSDIISSSAHQYGIWWHEQLKTSSQSETVFQRREMFADLVSQTHALQHVDIDGDGRKDLVTGKRWWAHGPKGDPGSDEAANLYWFQAQTGEDGGTTFIERLIHGDSGIGTQFVVADVDGDTLPDIVTSNKKGVHLFLQRKK